MKLIPLSNGGFTKVDDDDFDMLSEYKWHLHTKGAVETRKGEYGRIYIHRLIMNPPEELLVDHINMDKTDNQKANLRLATNSENLRNRGKQKDNTSGFKGVYRRKDIDRWDANIKVNNRRFYLGCFKTAEEAAEAYRIAANELHGEFARI